MVRESSPSRGSEVAMGKKVLLLGDKAARGKEIIQGLQNVARMEERTEIDENNSVLFGHLGVRDLNRAEEALATSVPVWNLLHVDGTRYLSNQISSLDIATSVVFILLNGESPWDMKMELSKWICALRDIISNSRTEMGVTEDNTKLPPLHVLVNKCEHLDSLSHELQEGLSFHLRSECLTVDASLMYMAEKPHHFKHIYATIMETLFHHETPMMLVRSVNTESPCIWIPRGYDTQATVDATGVDSQMRDIYGLYAVALLNQVLSVGEFNRLLALSTEQTILASKRITKKKSVMFPSKHLSGLPSRMSVRFSATEEQSPTPLTKTCCSDMNIVVRKGSILRRTGISDVDSRRRKSGGAIMSDADSPRESGLTPCPNNSILQIKTGDSSARLTTSDTQMGSTLIPSDEAGSISSASFQRQSDLPQSTAELDRQTLEFTINSSPSVMSHGTSSTALSTETMSDGEYSRRLEAIKNKRKVFQRVSNNSVHDAVMNVSRHRSVRSSHNITELQLKRSRKKANSQSGTVTSHYREILQRRAESVRTKNKLPDAAKVREMVDAGLDPHAAPECALVEETHERQRQKSMKSSMSLARLRKLRLELTGQSSPASISRVTKGSSNNCSSPANNSNTPTEGFPVEPFPLSFELLDFDAVSDVSFNCKGRLSKYSSICSSQCSRDATRFTPTESGNFSLPSSNTPDEAKHGTDRFSERRRRCHSIAVGLQDAEYRHFIPDQPGGEDIMFGRSQRDQLFAPHNKNQGSSVLKEFSDDFRVLAMFSVKTIPAEQTKSSTRNSSSFLTPLSEHPLEEILTAADDLANELEDAEKQADVEVAERQTLADELTVDISFSSGLSVRPVGQPILHLPPPEPLKKLQRASSERTVESKFASLPINSSINDSLVKKRNLSFLEDGFESPRRILSSIMEESITFHTCAHSSSLAVARVRPSSMVKSIQHYLGSPRTSIDIVNEEGSIPALPPTTPTYRKHHAHSLLINAVRTMMIKQGPSFYIAGQLVL